MILQMYLHYWISSAILAAANLGVADVIDDDEPREAASIAEALGVDPSCLLRLLRGLAAVGVFRERGKGSFVHTPRSAALRTDHPSNARALIRMLGLKSTREAMTEYENAIRTGRSAYEFAHGIANPFEVVGRRPDEAAIYHAGMSVDGDLLSALLERIDFSGVHRIVDVGGGNGRLLARLLQRYPHARGVLFDLPEVVADAVLGSYGVSDRAEVVAGDMRLGVPAGGDCYILKYILHGKSDADCIGLLRTIRSQALSQGRVLIIENVMSDSANLDFPKVFDLFLLLGGRETRVRSEEEFKGLLEHAGLGFARVVPIAQGQCVVEARVDQASGNSEQSV